MTHQPVRRVALASPYAWPASHPVNDHVAELAAGFREAAAAAGSTAAAASRGSAAAVPEVVVIAPSVSGKWLRDTRRALRELAQGASADDVLAAEALQHHVGDVSFPVLAVGLPIGLGRASVALRANLRTAFEHACLDLLFVHDPLASDMTRSAVRMWHGLTAALFHELPGKGTLAGLTGPLRERLSDQVDLRLVPNPALIAPLVAMLGGDELAVDVVPTVAATSHTRQRADDAGDHIVLGRGTDDDALVKAVLRNIASRSTRDAPAEATLLSRWATHRRPATPRPLRGKLHTVRARTRAEADEVLARASQYIAFPGTPQRAIDEARAVGVPVACVPTLDHAAQPVHLAGAAAALPTREQLAADMIDRLRELTSKRHVHIPAPPSRDRTCMIDLHMHTNHSWDCATDPEALLWAAREVGLTAIAVTDHNEISGAQVCAELADEYGIQVIVGEEVKTSQGEVIGLFLSERIEKGLSWAETIRQIREQDGLVYVPHPFDRLHTIPDVHTLRATIDQIDAFEVYNARLAFEQYNRDAERFARKYNLTAGAGSDAHVTQGLGTAAVHMPAWDDRESFLRALRQGEIVRRPKSFLYLQTRKFIQTRTGKTDQGTAAAE